MTLPKQYAWLANEPGPRLLKVALDLYGTAEKPGPGSNPSILQWARATGLDRVYRDDATAWCGLFMAYVALQAGWELPVNPLGARNWLSWGRVCEPELGAVLVFARPPSKWSGHVGIYVGEDRECYHVLGGNQSDAVTIKRVARDRLLGARECPWRVARPGNVRWIGLAATGAPSTNEA